MASIERAMPHAQHWLRMAANPGKRTHRHMPGTGTGSKTGKASPRRPKTTRAGLRVVDNAVAQDTDAIAQAALPEAGPETRTRARVHGSPTDQAVEEIRPAAPASNAPRLANGFKIVDNRAYQRKQKIKRAPLTVPADDEMGHKKLFTRFEEAFSTRDMAALRDCLSPAFTWKLPNGQVVYGRDAALDEMERRFAMPNGPKFSGSVWRFRGNTVLQTYDVEYLGPDGRWRQSQGFDLYEIGDGLITLKDAYWKMIP